MTKEHIEHLRDVQKFCETPTTLQVCLAECLDEIERLQSELTEVKRSLKIKEVGVAKLAYEHDL